MIKNLIKKIDNAFNSLKVSKLDASVMVFFVCLYALAEFGGISMLMPVLQYVSEGTDIKQQNELTSVWKAIVAVTEYLSLPLNLVTLLSLAFIPILLRQFFYYMGQSCSIRIRNKAIERIRSEGVSKFLRTDLDFFVKYGQGNLISALTVEAQRGGNAISKSMDLVSSIVLVVMYTVLLFLLSPLLTVIAVIGFTLIFLLTRPLIRLSKQYSAKISEHNKNMYKQIGDKLYGIRLIKMRFQEKNDSEKVGMIINKLSTYMTKAETAGVKIMTIVEPSAIFSIFLILYVAVEFFSMNLASVGILLFVLLRLSPHIKTFNITLQAINANTSSLEYVRKTIKDAEALRLIHSGPVKFSRLKHDIVFDRVGFSYDQYSGKSGVLKDISVRIPCESFTAIVGSSGAGKSTLVDLIPRLKDPTSGEIRIDGVSIKEYDLKSLRSKIGFLTQETFLFNDTVFNNLTYGLNGRVTMSDVESAVSKTRSNMFIAEMPDGYRTIIGDRGIRLSGGQKQRLALSRLILQDPEIIILDEYTSSLDSESEMYIQEAMDDVRRGRTMIVIAHRLASIRQADRILVLENGEITESGKLSILLNDSNTFKRIFESQVSFQEVNK